MTLRVLDLFSGIGGFSLGLERAGMKTAAFCEIDPYCRKILSRRWPEVPIYDDVRTLTAARLAADGIIRSVGHANGASSDAYATRGGSREAVGQPGGIDVICGGFPCQDISVAGKGAGMAGARSGLWGEYARLVGELRPRYVLVENVAALLHRGLDRVLGDLAALGYDADWNCIPASAVGAPHRRDRVWIVAYPNGSERRPIDRPCGHVQRPDSEPQGQEGAGRSGREGADVAYPDRQGRLQQGGAVGQERRRARNGGFAGILGTARRHEAILGVASEPGLPLGQGPARERPHAATGGTSWWAAQSRMGLLADGSTSGLDGHWLTEPNIPRVATGVAERVNKLRALGNAVIPQIPEIIGRAILAADVAAKLEGA